MSHLSNEQMSGYARRALDAEGLLLADDHLSACNECRSRLIDVAGLKETVESLRRDLRTALDAPTGHLPYDQIEARAEGRLRGAAREVAETHLEHCAACARQARDLETFAAAFRTRAQGQAAAASSERGSSPDRGSPHPAAAPSASAAPPSTAVARPARRVSVPATEVSPAAAEALIGAGAGPARSRLWPIVLGLLAAIVVAAAILGARSVRQRIGRLNQTVEDLSRRNQELEAQAALTEERPAEGPAGAAPVDATAAQTVALPPSGNSGSAAAEPDAAPIAQQADTATPGAGAGAAAAETPLAAPSPAPAAAPAAPTVPAVSLQDQRGTVGLDGNGNLLGLDGVPPGEATIIASALQRGSLEVPDDIRTLATIPKAIALDDNAAGMALLSGASTCVRGTRPTLSWQPVEGAQVYTIVLFSTQGRPLYYGGPTGETSWTPPAPLRRGAIYTWRVAAYRPSGTQAVARGGAAAPPPSEKLAGAATRFKVIDAASASSLERTLRAAPGSRLVAGVLYARAGLLDDAGREFRALAAQNPDSGLAKALLASVEAARLP